MTYKAIIAPIKNIRNHSNADRLKIGRVCYKDVIVGLDTEENTLGVYFPDDGVLNEEFCRENNLYRHTDYNKYPEAKGGFFEDNRRVRTLKLRGERSEGFWCPLGLLSYTGYNLSKLKEGFEFDELNGHKICKKYITPATMKKAAGNGNKNKDKKLKMKDRYPDFKEHWDTKKLEYYIQLIPKGAVLQISEKVHGTSHRVAKLRQYKQLNWFQKTWNKYLPIKFKEYEYSYISGTRRTIMNDDFVDGFYKDSNFREQVHNRIVQAGLLRGETIFMEIVGYQ
jgi:hypothetical protein